jgi:uncharacterized protein (TIGR02246 family)
MVVLAAGLLAAGLLGASVQAAPLPSPALAEAQLRALHQRVVAASVAADDDFIDASTNADFRWTRRDGAWLDRAAFLAQRPTSSSAGASVEDLRVRLFGPVALLHGVVAIERADGDVEKLRHTDVYLWNGAAWQRVSAQETLLEDPLAVQLQSATAPKPAPWQGRDPVGDDIAVLRALNEHYVRAFREADVAWYDAHLAPDYVVVSGDGSFQDRAAALADFAKPYFADHMRSFPVDEVTIRRFGDVALMHAQNAYQLKDGRRGVDRYTDIWARQDGRWRCVAAHITVHQPPT